MLKALLVLLFAVGCWGVHGPNDVPSLRDYAYEADLAPITPYQAEIRHNGEHVCSGAVIGMYEVLTVASCVFLTSAKDLTIHVGSVDTRTSGNVFQAEEKMIHPFFDVNTKDHDFALVKVGKPFPLGRDVYIADLAFEELPSGSSALVSGWVLDSEGSSTLNPLLNVARVTIMSKEDCNATYMEFGGITDTMICTSVPESSGNGGSCVGDVGAPLVVNGTLYGLASWGDGCTSTSKNVIVYSDATLLSYFVKMNTFLSANAYSELCAALELIVSLLPAIPVIPAWVITALNLLIKLVGC